MSKTTDIPKDIYFLVGFASVCAYTLAGTVFYATMYHFNFSVFGSIMSAIGAFFLVAGLAFVISELLRAK